jgi:hypothetical protein
VSDKFWVGGTGTWATAARWSLTSGGAGGAGAPGAGENAFFDGNSGAGTATIGAAATCANLDFTGYTGALAGASTLAISGSLTFAVGMTNSYTGTITFNDTSGTTQPITSNGITIGSALNFNGAGGVWQLADNMVCNGAVTLTAGTFDTNSKTLRSAALSSSNANVRTLKLAACIWTLTGTGTIWTFSTATNATVTTSGSKLIIKNATATGKSFTPGGMALDDVTVDATTSGAITLSGAATAFRDLTISATAAGCTWSQGFAVTCRNFDFTGFGGAWSSSGASNVSGNFTLSGAMTRTYTGALTFNATSGTKVITSNGITLGGTTTFNGVGGTWQLADNFASTSTATLTNGAFISNGKSLTCSAFLSSNTNTRSIDISNSTIRVSALNTGVFNLGTSAGLTVTATGSIIIVDNTGGVVGVQTLSLASFTFSDVQFIGTAMTGLTINGANPSFRDFSTTTLGASVNLVTTVGSSWRNFTLTTGGLARNLLFSTNTVHTATSWTLTGGAADAMNIQNGGGGQTTLSQAGGQVSGDYLTLTSLRARGGARWFAGRHSTNVANSNNGWNFSDAAPRPAAYTMGVAA